MTLLAIFHCSIKIISRGKGRSAVAAAAYHAAEKIKNEYDGELHDYTKKGGVVYAEILLPDHAPAEYADRSTLWNSVEKVERYKTAQLAREIELALPVELTAAQNISLMREYVNQHFVSAGMCADIAIHDTGEGNPHAHIMRPIENGEWGAKSRTVDGVKIPAVDWNEQTKAEEWREGWAKAVNAVLERENHPARVDHRSYARQGIDQIPTVHLGVAAHQMEKRGIRTERGDINREIDTLNQQLRQLKARMSKAQKELAKIAKEPEAPSAIDTVLHILDQPSEGNRAATRKLKTAAEVLSFLQTNKIYDMETVEQKIKEMLSHQSEVRDKLKPIDRRLKVLSEHLKQVEIRREYRPIYEKYKTLSPRKQKQFEDEHRPQLTMYKSAGDYLKAHLNGRDKIPVKAWEKERERLLAEKAELGKSVMSLTEQMKQIDRIHKSARELLPQQPRRDRGRDLER